MQISPSLETRAYPEMWSSCSAENELEFRASLLLRANPGNKFHPIEPGPNSNLSRKSFEDSILTRVARSGVSLIRWDVRFVFFYGSQE